MTEEEKEIMRRMAIEDPFWGKGYVESPDLQSPNPIGHQGGDPNSNPSKQTWLPSPNNNVTNTGISVVPTDNVPAIDARRAPTQPWKFDPSMRGVFGATNDQGVKTHEGLLGGILGGAKDLFNDPRRMALITGGLRMADPNSYYDSQGFYSPWGGINAGLGTGIKTYRTLSEPTKLGFKEQEEIKQANALALTKAKHTNTLAAQADKAKHLIPKTAKDANNRLRYSSGDRTGELVYKDLTVAPESMDANQIVGAELKLGKEFNVMIGGKLAQVEAYRRIEAIYDDPFRPDPLVNNPMVGGPNGPIKIDKVLKKDGDVFNLEAGGAADLALIFNFMKMLDPASVVRESEFALAEATGALPDWLKKEWSKVTDGGRLTPAMRRNIMRQARNQYDSAEKDIGLKYKEYVKRAEQYKDWGIKADRALMYTPYEPTIRGSQFAPAVTVGGVPPVDPNNPLNLNLPE